MTELVTAQEISSERPLAWRLAHDARVRYVLLVGGACGRVLRRGADRLRAEVHRGGRGDRLAAGRRRHRVPLPGRLEPVARGRPGRSACEPVRDAPDRLRHRADDRQHARSAGRGVSDPSARAQRASAGQRGWSVRPPRRDLRGHRGQRDDRAHLVAPRPRAVDIGTCLTSGTPGGSVTPRARSSSSRSPSPGGSRSSCPGRGRESPKEL